MTATAVPTTTATPTPIKATPTATPTSNALSYYIDSVSGSDTNIGTSPASPWKTLSKVQSVIAAGGARAGMQFLFASGESWSGGLELSGLSGTTAAPIVFSYFNSGARPVLDGGGSAKYGFHAASGSNVTIDGFEIRNFTYNGVSLHSSGGAMPGWIVENCLIHNTGPGAYAGGSGAYDDGGYRNQLELLDYGYHADGVRFINNTVHDCGGHNCIQVHGDTGSPLIEQNTCYGWLHNCIDVKAVVGASVKNNLVHGPAPAGAAFYIENTQIPAADVTWRQNVAYSAPNGFECEGGGGTASNSVTCRAYNNTTYLGTESAIVTGSGCTQPITWDVRNNILDTTHATYVPSSCTNRNVTWDYNDDCGSMGTCTSAYIGAHDLNGINPEYVNAGGNPPDFHLQAGSLLINAGLPGLTLGDIDIGAY